MLKQMIKTQNFLTESRHMLADRKGATAIEYGLIAGLLSVVIITALTLAGPALEGIFTKISGALVGAAPADGA